MKTYMKLIAPAAILAILAMTAGCAKTLNTPSANHSEKLGGFTYDGDRLQPISPRQEAAMKMVDAIVPELSDESCAKLERYAEELRKQGKSGISDK